MTREQEILNWQKFLRKNEACTEGYKEACNKTSQEWFEITERSDWMIWVLRKIPQYRNNKVFWVKIAIQSAELIIHLSKDSEQRPQKAIQATKDWLETPSEENRIKARCAAAAAAYAAADAADVRKP